MDHVLRSISTRLQKLGRRWRVKFHNLVQVGKERILVIKDCPHPLCFHVVFWMATSLLIVPFKVKVLDKYYARLNMVGLPRRLVNLFVATNVAAHVFILVSVAIRNSFNIMAVGGNVTTDGLVYFAISINTTFSLIYIIKLHFMAVNTAALYNGWKKFLTEYTEEVLQGQHLYQVFPRDLKLNIMSAMLCFVTLGQPFFNTVLISLYQKSPMLITSEEGNFEVSWLTPFLLRLIALTHTSAVYTAMHVDLLFVATVFTEFALEILFFLRTLRMKEFKTRSLMQVRRHHIVVEVTTAVVNEVLDVMPPLLISHAFSATVVCIALAVKLTGVPDIPFYVPLIAFTCAFAILFTIWFIARLAEDIRSESLDFNNWLEYQMFMKEHHKREAGRRLLRKSCRMFRRRAVGIRMSFFYRMEVGLALDYVLSIFDKAISLIMMVDSSYPLKLLGF